MEFRILNKDFIDIRSLDTYSSFIWSERYNHYGDFEIVVGPTDENLESLKEDFYVWSLESEHTMIIEDVRISTDVEIGNELIITGRSLESILSGRTAWQTIILEGNVQQGIQRLLNESIINPIDSSRRIPNFVFNTNNDPYISSLTFDSPVEVSVGSDIFTKVRQLCVERYIGFKITLSEDNNFIFSLYSGIDRSYNQSTNPYVIFSPEFDNLFNSNFFSSVRGLRTVALVGGENPRDETQERIFVEVSLPSGGGSGLSRRELFVDASGISRNIGRPEEVPLPIYIDMLRQRGLETLALHIRETAFEGGIDISNMYVFGVDFFMGDIVQVANEFRMEHPSRIVELIRSLTNEGFKAVPTFVTIM